MAFIFLRCAQIIFAEWYNVTYLFIIWSECLCNDWRLPVTLSIFCLFSLFLLTLSDVFSLAHCRGAINIVGNELFFWLLSSNQTLHFFLSLLQPLRFLWLLPSRTEGQSADVISLEEQMKELLSSWFLCIQAPCYHTFSSCSFVSLFEELPFPLLIH